MHTCLEWKRRRNEIYSFRYVWRAATELVRRARENEEGALYVDLAAMAMAFAPSRRTRTFFYTYSIRLCTRESASTSQDRGASAARLNGSIRHSVSLRQAMPAHSRR